MGLKFCKPFYLADRRAGPACMQARNQTFFTARTFTLWATHQYRQGRFFLNGHSSSDHFFLAVAAILGSV